MDRRDSAGAGISRRVIQQYWEAPMEQQPGPLGPGVAVTHILVVADPGRSRDFWVDVLGAELYREYGGSSVVLRFAGTWLCW